MPQYEDVYEPPVMDATFAEKIDELKEVLEPPIPDFVSDAFSVSRAYAVGEYCIYENHFYKFTSAKSAGAWDSTKVQETTLAAEQSSTNSNLAQKQDTLTVSTMSVTSDQTPNPFASGVTGYINLVKYGRVVCVTGVIKLTSATTNLDICTLPSGYRPHATNVWLSSDYYGDTSGCEFRIITNGSVNCAVPSGSINKDIKVSGSFIANA